MSHTLARNWKWILIGLAAVSATRIYYVQEMIAALIIFSVLFVCVALALVILFLLDRGSQRILDWAETEIVRIVHWAVDLVESIVAGPAWLRAAAPHRYRREQLKNK